MLQLGYQNGDIIAMDRILVVLERLSKKHDVWLKVLTFVSLVSFSISFSIAQTETSSITSGPSFAPKEYYLADSIDLSAFNQRDSTLLEEALKKYHESSSDTSRIKALVDICENMMNDQWMRYQYFQSDLIDRALESTDSTNEGLYQFLRIYKANARHNLGFIAKQKGDYATGLKYYLEGLKIREEVNDSAGMAQSYNNIGLIYDNLGDIKTSIDYYLRSLKILEQTGDKRGMAYLCNNLAFTYDSQGEGEEVIKYHSKSLKIREEIGDKKGMGQSYIHLGQILYRSGDSAQGLAYLNKAMELHEEIDDAYGLTYAYNSLGMFYQNQALHEKAIEYFKEARDLRLKIQDKKGLSSSYYNLALSYSMLNRNEIALENGKKGLELAKTLGVPDLIRKNAWIIANAAAKLKKYDVAYNHLILEYKMKDSISNRENLTKLIRQQDKHEFDKQQTIEKANFERELERERHKTEIEQHENDKKQQLLYFAIVIGVLLVVFIVLIANRLKVTRSQKTIIEEYNEELKQINEEIAAQRDQIDRQKQIVEHAHLEIQSSIQYAKRLQDAILPSFEEMKQHLPEHFILFKPRDVVSGDFYWFERVENHLFIAAADCTGHGVPGAMVSVVCANALNRSVLEFGLTDPADILNSTRDLVVKTFSKRGGDVKDGMDISLAVMDVRDKQKMLWAGANNPIYIVRNKQYTEADNPEKVEIVKADREAIGQTQKASPFTTHTIELHKGDLFYLFSDGLADQFGGPKGKKFGYKRFRKMISEMKEDSMEVQKEQLQNGFEQWRSEANEPQLDDVCIIGIRIDS